mmetsp:Transcript_26141/g.56701  ORF Transcript_26141/g.56701 Transcript_26141/m.56701 type:complete len:361 (+) Transcript_26141:408-1490(+)
MAWASMHHDCAKCVSSPTTSAVFSMCRAHSRSGLHFTKEWRPLGHESILVVRSKSSRVGNPPSPGVCFFSSRCGLYPLWRHLRSICIWVRWVGSLIKSTWCSLPPRALFSISCIRLRSNSPPLKSTKLQSSSENLPKKAGSDSFCKTWRETFCQHCLILSSLAKSLRSSNPPVPLECMTITMSLLPSLAPGMFVSDGVLTGMSSGVSLDRFAVTIMASRILYDTPTLSPIFASGAALSSGVDSVGVASLGCSSSGVDSGGDEASPSGLVETPCSRSISEPVSFVVASLDSCSSFLCKPPPFLCLPAFSGSISLASALKVQSDSATAEAFLRASSSGHCSFHPVSFSTSRACASHLAVAYW